MKKPTSPQKTTDTSPAGDQPEPESIPPYSDGLPLESETPPPENNVAHNGSANAFDATEEARDDEDSDEDNDDFARDYK